MVKAKKFILRKHFVGFPHDSDLPLVEEEVGKLGEGEALAQALYLSVDPYMRPYTDRLPEGIDMIGEQLARVIESRNDEYQVGSLVLGQFGWRTHTKFGGKADKRTFRKVNEKSFDGLPLSLSLGAIGMPGMTAYCGLLHSGELKSGETVLVNAAAGAVGSVVGQVAKIKGCKVIGYAGTEAKCDWLRELGFDHVFNYKTCDLDQTLSEAAPEGVNVYFDNVGGKFSHTVLSRHMAMYGRIVVCGVISTYNATQLEKEDPTYHMILVKRLTIRGIIIYENFTPHQWAEALTQLGKWIQEGKIKYKETVTEGFENMRQAFFGLFKGENTGKAVVKV